MAQIVFGQIQQAVAVSLRHALYEGGFGVGIQFQSLLIVVGRLLHIVEGDIVLAELEIDVGAWTFEIQVMEQHLQIAGSAHTLLRFRDVAFMVEGEGNLEGLRLPAVQCADLLVDAALIMAVFPVKKPADAFRHNGADALDDVGIVADDHADAAAVGFQRVLQFCQIDVLQIFVTVYDKHPVIGCLLDREISGGAEILYPFKGENFVRIFLAMATVRSVEPVSTRTIS